jgi:Co/Zn/Cd efflux system component
MHSQSVAGWQHEHAFLGKKHDVHERRTWVVVALATVMMITEIVGGWLFGSMALMADGLHMSDQVIGRGVVGRRAEPRTRRADPATFGGRR